MLDSMTEGYDMTPETLGEERKLKKIIRMIIEE
jgi:hypothetical protein